MMIEKKKTLTSFGQETEKRTQLCVFMIAGTTFMLFVLPTYWLLPI
jgi:hypothetical protein